MDPITSIAAGFNSSFRILEVTYQLKAVGQQVADLLSTTQHVDTNLNEARRLRRVKNPLMNNGERTWIDAVIDDTEKALRAVQQLIEPARVDTTTKHAINFGHKVLWVFRDNPQVRDKHARLGMCHQSLTTVIGCLYSKDVVVITSVPEEKKEEQPPPYDPQMEQLFNWRNPRTRRKSYMTLRGGGAERPMSTDSASTDTTLASRMSGFANIIENADDRALSINSNPIAPSVTGAISPFASPKENVVERLMSASSVSTIPIFTNPMGLFVQEQDGVRPVPIHAEPARTQVSTHTIPTILEQRQMDEEASHRRLPYPMSPSDYSTRSFSEATEQAFNFGTDNPYLATRPQLPKPQAMMGSDAGPASIASPILPKIDNRPFTLAESLSRCFDGADGLQVQEEEPISEKHCAYRPDQPSSISNSSLSSLPSIPTSSPPRIYSVGESSGCHPPRFPSKLTHDRVTSIELGSSAIATYSERTHLGWGETRPIEGRAGVEGDTGRPLSGMRRGGRSWLMFHANRSDMGHYMG